MNGLAWIDGSILSLAEAKIALDDPGYLLGDGVFETLRARRGHVFRWDLHAARLGAGLAAVGIGGAALAVAERAVHELAACAAGKCEGDLYLRVQASRTADGEGFVTALARALPEYPAYWYRDGVRLAFADWRRDPDDPLAGVKSLSYLPQVWARRAAQAKGCDDALILNTHGRVCESAHGNVIARRGRTLCAPAREEGALDGVTRRVLIAALSENGYALQFSLDRKELETADEVLLVSTLAGVVSVAAIEGLKRRYAGPSGELTARLTRTYEAFLDSQD